MYADDVDVATNWPKAGTGPVSAKLGNKNMAVGTDGSVYITGQATMPDNKVVLALWQYSESGTLVQFRTWQPVPYPTFKPTETPSYPEGIAVDVDNVGNAYVVGTFKTPMQGTDIVYVTFPASGATPVATTINGLGNGDDYGVDIKIGGAGTLWIGGVVQGAGTGQDYFLRGQSLTSGATVAQVTFNHANFSDTLVDIDTIYNVELAGGGSGAGEFSSVYIGVTGTSHGSLADATQEDIQTIVYEYNLMSGVFGLASDQPPRFATPGVDKATSIDMWPPASSTTTTWGSVFVSGYNDDRPSLKTQMVVLGYLRTAQITTDWQAIYDHPVEIGQRKASATKLVVGQSAESGETQVYVLGDLETAAGQRAHVRAFSFGGGGLWSYLHNPAVGGGDDYTADVDVAPLEGIYITMTRILNGNVNYRSIKISTGANLPPGSEEWDIDFDGGYDLSRAIRHSPVAGEDGLPHIYVSGHSSSPSLPGPTQYSTLRYFQTP